VKVISSQWPVFSKRAVGFSLCALLFTLCVSVEAQQPKLAKIGLFRASSAEREAFIETLRRELSALAYVDGKNIAFEFRAAENKFDCFPALVDELVRLKVDILITSSTAAALAAKKATATIPIILMGVTDPVAAGLVDSLARPGGNITGFTSIPDVLSGKRLELLKETVSKISRVGVLWNPQDPASVQQWKESAQAARQLRLQPHSMEVSSADKYEDSFNEAIKAGVLAFAAPQDSLAGSNQKKIVQLAAKHRLPGIYSRTDFVENGGLMSYGWDRSESFKRVSAMVDKILKGTKPADIPVEQPKKFEFIVNLKTAKQIGVTIPPNVLARADRVIR
jgi:putative tryptophan/tyrosine transport system substrate-binding protein